MKAIEDVTKEMEVTVSRLQELERSMPTPLRMWTLPNEEVWRRMDNIGRRFRYKLKDFKYKWGG